MAAPEFFSELRPKLFAQKVRGFALKLPDQIGNGPFGMGRNHQMDVIIFAAKLK